MTQPSFNLQQHLHQEHNNSPFSTYLKEIVYGGNDGIVTTFAVVAGFAGAQAQNIGSLPVITVLIFGFANLFSDAVSMALGNFLSTRAEQDVYKKEQNKERHEIQTNPQTEYRETIELLKIKGFTPQQATTLTDIYQSNPKYWLEFMMKDELELSDPSGENPTYMALATFISFIVFGFIPLIPYLLFKDIGNTFSLSIIATILALVSLGILRWRVTKFSPLRAIGETLTVGGLAAIVAYLVGTFFKI